MVRYHSQPCLTSPRFRLRSIRRAAFGGGARSATWRRCFVPVILGAAIAITVAAAGCGGGPARPQAELAAIRQAIPTTSTIAVKSAMRPLAATAIALADHPVPRCADTRGLYAALVDSLYQAGHNAMPQPCPAECALQRGRCLHSNKQCGASPVAPGWAATWPVRCP